MNDICSKCGGNSPLTTFTHWTKEGAKRHDTLPFETLYFECEECGYKFHLNGRYMKIPQEVIFEFRGVPSGSIQFVES